MYAISVIYPPNTTTDQFRQMLASLLAERFGLAFHRQSVKALSYELRAAGSGASKLNAISQGTGSQNDQVARSAGAEGTRWSSIVDGGMIHLSFRQSNMATLANALKLIINNYKSRQSETISVGDHSGITGTFDFQFEFAIPERSSENNPDPEGVDIRGLSESLKKQLGLLLNATTGSRDVLIVDHVNQVPTEN
jgi:uncharacterized protein (TIGR03435 family)